MPKVQKTEHSTRTFGLNDFLEMSTLPYLTYHMKKMIFLKSPLPASLPHEPHVDHTASPMVKIIVA